MKQALKILISASFYALFLIGCGGSVTKYPTSNTQKGTQGNTQNDDAKNDNAQKIVKNYKGVWVRDSYDGNKTGCINDDENGVSHFRKIMLDDKFKTVDISFSELNCEQDDIDTNVTKVYTYALDTKNSSATKDGTKMYGIDLTLEEINQDNSYSGEKDYLIIGKNSKKLIFIGRQYSNTKNNRDNFIKYNLKDINNDSGAIINFINR